MLTEGTATLRLGVSHPPRRSPEGWLIPAQHAAKQLGPLAVQRQCRFQRHALPEGWKLHTHARKHLAASLHPPVSAPPLLLLHRKYGFNACVF